MGPDGGLFWFISRQKGAVCLRSEPFEIMVNHEYEKEALKLKPGTGLSCVPMYIS